MTYDNRCWKHSLDFADRIQKKKIIWNQIENPCILFSFTTRRYPHEHCLPYDVFNGFILIIFANKTHRILLLMRISIADELLCFDANWNINFWYTNERTLMNMSCFPIYYTRIYIFFCLLEECNICLLIHVCSLLLGALYLRIKLLSSLLLVSLSGLIQPIWTQSFFEYKFRIACWSWLYR